MVKAFLIAYITNLAIGQIGAKVGGAYLRVMARFEVNWWQRAFALGGQGFVTGMVNSFGNLLQHETLVSHGMQEPYRRDNGELAEMGLEWFGVGYLASMASAAFRGPSGSGRIGAHVAHYFTLVANDLLDG
jgi:hypothetical protein